MVGRLLTDIDADGLLETKVGKKELDKRLEEGIKKKAISGEQWFRKPENWYALTSYSNPFKTPYTELRLLIEKSKKLKPHLNKTRKAFYGIGTGDSEIIPVIWDIETHNYTEVIVIDAIKEFIHGFVQSLRNLRYENLNSKIMFKGYHTLFELLTKNDFEFYNSDWERVVHICLGNTIGNFEQKEIFSIFTNNMDKNDLLLLGFQLNLNPQLLLNQYADNSQFEKLIRESIGNKLKSSRKLIWRYNHSNDTVEAWLGEILVFKSKKYNIKKLIDFAGNFNLAHVNSLTNGKGGIGVCLFKKK